MLEHEGVGRGGPSHRRQIASGEPWLVVPRALGYDARFAVHLRHPVDQRLVAAVVWPIGEARPVVRISTARADDGWWALDPITAACECGTDACLHGSLYALAADHGLQDNAQLDDLPYQLQPNESVSGIRHAFTATLAFPLRCAPSRPAVMGGRSGWSLDVESVGGRSSFLASLERCTALRVQPCASPNCFHQLFLRWLARTRPGTLTSLRPRPNASLRVA